MTSKTSCYKIQAATFRLATWLDATEQHTTVKGFAIKDQLKKNRTKEKQATREK